MEQVDYKMLKEDIKFPLEWDCDEYKMYIFDADMNMVAQTEHKILDATRQYHPFEKLIGEFKDMKVFESKPRYRLYQGDFYDTELDTTEPIGLVRGWGRLQKKKNAEQRQDNIANYIVNLMNLKDD